MGKDIKTGEGVTVGLDLGDKPSEVCVLDAAGDELERFRVRTTEPALARRFGGLEPSRVVLEVGTHSPWVAGSSKPSATRGSSRTRGGCG